MTSNKPEYAVVQAQIVGNPSSGYETTYRTDGRRWPTREKAIRHGWNSLDHDDFLLAHLRGDRLVMTSWQYNDRPDEHGERAEMATQCGWRTDD